MLTCLRPKLSLTVFAVGAIKYSLCNFIQFVNFRSLFMHTLTCERYPTILGVYKEYRLCILLHVMNSEYWMLPCCFVVTELNRCIFLHVAKGD